MTEPKPSAGCPDERPSMNTPNQLIEAANGLAGCALWIAKNKGCKHDNCDGCDGVDAQALIELEHRANAVAAAIEASTQDDWQEISSAPKDGTKVQLYRERWGVAEGAWIDGWVIFGSGLLHESNYPTHWMPLPNPPTAQPDEQAISDDEWRSDEEAQALIDAIHDEQVCPRCGGDGIDFDPNNPRKRCPRCGGSGKWRPLTGPALPLDEQVCSTCGGTEERDASGGQYDRYHHPCPDCQPVPPSEGEVAAGPYREGHRLEVSGQDFVAVHLFEEKGRAIANAAWREGFAANTPPDGHVAVYLPVEVSERAAKDWRDCSDETIDADEAVIEAACRTALEVE